MMSRVMIGCVMGICCVVKKPHEKLNFVLRMRVSCVVRVYLWGGEVEEGSAVERGMGIIRNGKRNTGGGDTTGVTASGGGGCTSGVTGGGGDVGWGDAEVVMGVDSVGGGGYEKR